MRLIDAEALRKNMEFICTGIMAGTESYNAPLTEIDNAPSGWIPIKTKKLSPEEIREFCEKTHEFSPEEMDGAWSYDCKLPEKTQDVLVTTRYEDVVITKFVVDSCGWYFEDFEDEGDLLAWMPLPEPYKKEENE